MPEDVNGTGGGMQIGTPGSFGNQGRIVGVNSNNPLGVVSSGSGDIILGSSKKKSKKYIFIIIAMILVFFLIFLFIFFYTKNSTRIAFNNFANYLLYGEDSNEDISGEYEWGYRYYARSIDVMAEEDSYEEYLNNLKQKYETLYKKSSNKLQDYNDIFWLFYYCSLYPDSGLSRREILKAQREGMNESEIKQTIEDYYAPFINSGNSLVKSYGEYREAYLLKGYFESDYLFPNYNFEIFSRIWAMKGEFYD